MARLSAFVTGSFLGSGSSGQVAVFGSDGRLSGTNALTVSSGSVTIGVPNTGTLHTINGDVAFGSTNASDAADIYRNSATGLISIQGGNTATPSAINIYGGTHATLASVIRFISANTVTGSISATGKWTLGASGTSEVVRLNTATTAAGVAAATLLNAPAGAAGDPDVWFQLDINGTTVVVPGWTP